MVHCSHMCLFITRHFVWHIPGIHTTMQKSGSYFICRGPLVKKWSVSFNHVSRSKVKAIGNSVKFLSGAYILSLWPNQANIYFIQKVLVERYCATALNQGFMSKVKYCATTLNQGLMSKVQVKIYLKISTVFPFHFKLQLLS